MKNEKKELILQNFPAELIAQKRWACSMDGAKRPYCPRVPEGYSSVMECSSIDPNTWFPFEDCTSNPTYERIGLFMDSSDSIVVVDIDDPCQHVDIAAICQNLPATYCEYSWSGAPKCHIFCRGKLQANFKAPGIEAYTRDRYIGVTGNTVPGRNYGITEQQAFLDWLWAKFGKDNTVATVSLDPEDLIPGEKEEQIISQLSDMSIFDGTTQNPAFRHPEGTDKAGYFNSEAESALATRLAMITDDAQAILKIMSHSPLIMEMADYPWHNRNKILARIMNHTIPSAIRHGKRVNEVNLAVKQANAELARGLLEGMSAKAQAEAKAKMDAIPPAPTSKPIAPDPDCSLGFAPRDPRLIVKPVSQHVMDRLTQAYPDLPYPFGLVGEIAQHVYETAYSPLRKGSLFSALAFCAGIFSNNYYFRGTGLNLYLVLTAPVGDGKDALHTTPEKMLNEVTAASLAQVGEDQDAGIVHGRYQNYIHSGIFTSKKALLRQFDERKGIAMFQDEVAKDWMSMLNPRASQHKQELKALYLNAYSRSGPGQRMDGTTYANADDDTQCGEGRALTLYGVTNSASFQDAIQMDDVADGFFARFIIGFDQAAEPASNPNSNKPMDDLLRHWLKVACDWCPQLVDLEETRTEVQITQNAVNYLDEIQLAYQKKKKSFADKDMRRSLISRAGQNIQRIAAIVAIGKYFWNPENFAEFGNIPTIRYADVEWAFRFISDALSWVFGEAERGVFAPNAEARLKQVIQIIVKTLEGNLYTSKYSQTLIDKGYIDRNHIMSALGNSKAWRAEHNYGKDKPFLLDVTLQEMCNRCYLELATVTEANALKTKRKIYKIGEAFNEGTD